MKKRGVLLELGALVLVLITTLGVVISVSNTQNLYIGKDTGNMTQNYFVNYYKCKDIAKNIPEDRLRVFTSKEEAINLKYRPVKGCI